MHVSVTHAGDGRQPVLVVDNFLGNPEVLIDYAAAHSVFDQVSDTFYPGERAPIPAIYSYAVRAFLGAAIAEAFALGAAAVTRELSHFSLVTTPPEHLTLLQRMPHFDNTDPRQLAVLHYLCGPGFGGTSFYRHRATGFEFIDESRRAAYSRAVREELAALRPAAPRYICGDDAMFARTASFAADFNRILVYHSISLHSADIAPGFAFSGDPRTGRLTANTFFFYE